MNGIWLVNFNITEYNGHALQKNSTYKSSLFESIQMNWANERTNAHKVVELFLLCYVFSLSMLLLSLHAQHESASIYCVGIFNILQARQWSLVVYTDSKVQSSLSLTPTCWRRTGVPSIIIFFLSQSMTNALLLFKMPFIFFLWHSIYVWDR